MPAMAKAKRKAGDPAPEAVPIPPEPAPATVRTILSMRGSDEWSEWLSDAAQWARTDRVGFLDRAAAELAEKLGFRRPPPRL